MLAGKSSYAVVVNYLTHKQRAEVVANEIEHLGSKEFVMQADISKPNEISQMYSRIDRECGSIHGLVNNAGVLEPQMSIDRMDNERLQRVMQTSGQSWINHSMYHWGQIALPVRVRGFEPVKSDNNYFKR